ncbi:MAG: DUF192 domain-containing protein [Bacteroidetes bacterium]|nr:MAG: DUF192 domain-containing protein [Bacteroidota bacterium]
MHWRSHSLAVNATQKLSALLKDDSPFSTICGGRFLYPIFPYLAPRISASNQSKEFFPMAHRKPRRKKPTRPKGSGGGRRKMSLRQWLIVVFMGLALVALILPNLPNRGGKRTQGNVPEKPAVEPQFQKEGELSFINGNTGRVIRTIDIEIAEDEVERTQGLMWRRHMDDTQGMLFIFPKAEPQGFWMKNTYIPLDIIFVGPDMRILNIHANTKPESERTLLSDGRAQYVVEVPGGFCRRYGIAKGDKIQFTRN